jgi:hypothetical protein
MRRALLACLLLVMMSFTADAQAPKADPADKAIADAVALLEKALADTKDPAVQAKLKAAIAAVKKAAEAPKVQNELISDFVDSPAKYKGKVVTFQLTYVHGGGVGNLTGRVGGKGVPFKGKDPKNGAELLLGVAIPAKMVVPAANDGEEVIVTFTCTKGEKTDGNVVVSITRP